MVRARREEHGAKESISSSLPLKRSASPDDGARKNPSKISLSMWLASAGESTDPGQLPPPVTCAAARLEDRDSVFIGYVYPITSASPTAISARLENLKHTVHPAIPPATLPPPFQHASAQRRVSTHDIYAYRVLQLKRGRSGLGGPDDFGIEQGTEDDGESWGAEKVMRVIRELGASDVMVVVSRWYGGVLLGPVRFEHIQNVTRAALQHFLALEKLAHLRAKLQDMDRTIFTARHPGTKMNNVQEYPTLTLENAQRLLLARTKTLEVLEKRGAGSV
ncbi:hypothetical protein MVES1_002357 [Malassezia vespertilionis]|uniref:Impact N-terminal domain-containing protein n=1 Tax=Malassezia vespertilionis TaxID=2020962 RepID=A0A2N1JBB6_9BASI|nr:uncharacterized protein MVES1_002357 [Malassezia vespertilionis]PKI83837.1 hypothetical protein MVES_002222 [Malassezia vespertilionis]WFD07002.1 hypothetical protein MVES1_002357 [Malassezia vespertilionis]